MGFSVPKSLDLECQGRREIRWVRCRADMSLDVVLCMTEENHRGQTADARCR